MGYLKENYQKIFYSLLGIFLVLMGIRSLWTSEVTSAVTSLAFGFFSFIFASLAKFKKFKGFGLEGELWEDKQKEAELLINKLKTTLEAFSNEIIITKVSSGRWDSSSDWRDTISLYNRLQEDIEGAGKLDLKKAREKLEFYFLFDYALPVRHRFLEKMSEFRQAAQNVINTKHPQPIVDSVGYGALVDLVRIIFDEQRDFGKFLEKRGYASELQRRLIENQKFLKDSFGISFEFDNDLMRDIDDLKKIEAEKPLVFSSDRIEKIEMFRRRNR